MINRSARIAIHMADATATGLPRSRPRRVPPIWRWWMTFAAMSFATSVVAVLVWTILRRGL